MSLLNSLVFEKVKPVLSTITTMIFGEEVQQPQKRKSVNAFDQFEKKQVKEIVNTPVSKKVWVNGQQYAVMASSQHELEIKMKNLSNKTPIAKAPKQLKEIDNVLFNAFYEKRQPLIHLNEWSEKGDLLAV